MKKLLLFFFALFSIFSFLFLFSNTVHAQYTCTIDGTVFVDNICQDGVQNCGEGGYNGATVNATGQSSKTTNINGYYSFPNLTGGTYRVTLTVPGGYNATTANPVDVGICPGTTVNFGIVLAPTSTPRPPTSTPIPPTSTPSGPTNTPTPIPPTSTPTSPPPPPAPTVTTDAATGITDAQAILNSTVNPNGFSTNVYYGYGTSPGVACSLQPNTLNGPTGLTGSSPLSGAATQATGFIPDLLSNTTYYFCAYSTNANGTTYNGVLSFTTLASTPTPTFTPTPTPIPTAPTVITFPATDITDIQAVLNSLVNPNNDLTNASYAYGTTDGVACSAQENTLTGPQNLTGTTDISPNATLLSDLLPNTTYYFCVYATNSLGTRYGVVLQFTTLGPTPTPGGPTLTPTPTPIPCQVTTDPTSYSLAIGGQGDVTASVTSGQGAASILQMRFGAYNHAVATVNPASDSNGTPDYRTKVTAGGGGATAVWASADLSDGRTCESTGATDTDITVSGPTATPTVTPGGPTPTITPTPIPAPVCSGGLSASPDTIGAGGGTVSFNLTGGCTPEIPAPTYTWIPPSAGTIGAGCTTSCTYTPPASVCSSSTITQKVTVSNAGGSKTYSKNITLTPRNIVSGTVYVDSEANACASGTTLYTTGAKVTLYTSNANANSDGNGAYSVVDNAACGTRNAVISNITNYRVVAARFAPAATFSNANLSSFTYGPFDLSSDHMLDWCISDLAPWFQTDKGDVRDTNLINKIPVGKYASLDALYPGVLVSTNWPTNFGAGSSSPKNWKVDSEYDYQKGSQNKNGTSAYSFYKNRAQTTGQTILSVPGCTGGSGATCTVSLTGGQNTLSTGIYEFDAGGTGTLTITGYTQSPGAHITLLVNGSVTIKSDISVPKAASNLFILAAKGDITIDPSVGQAPADPATSPTNIDGIYTSEGKIIAETSGDSCVSGVPDKQLIIGGVFIANSIKPFTTGGTGSFENKRSLCLDDKNYPSVYFSLRPDFALQLSDFYKSTIIRWKETAP